MEVKTEEVFEGFFNPTMFVVGFTQLPHEFIENLHKIESIAEIKVILYVMRHTWGFQEFDTWKHLTTDEFMYGRMTKDGRMDNGTGLSKVSVITGIEKAIEHGFLLCRVDNHDLARVRKSYKLKMR